MAKIQFIFLEETLMKIDGKSLVIAGCCGLIAGMFTSLMRSIKRELAAEDKASAYEAAYKSTNQQLIECKAKLTEYES
jgi:hypothetical protein